MSKLSPKSPLDGFSRKWGGLTLEEKHIGEGVSLAAALDQEEAFDVDFKKTFGTSPPPPSQAKQIEGGWAAWLGASQYMILLDSKNSRADEELAGQFGDCAYATLQTDGWALLDFTGDRAIDVLERFIPLDLRRAPKNFAARTSAHHIAVIVIKFDDDKYQLMTPRSSAKSFAVSLAHVIDNVVNFNQESS